MMQLRAKTGTDFEKECAVDGWVVKARKPSIKWSGKGRNNIQKIKSFNFDPSLFKILETTNFAKYDIYNPELDKYREVKKYKKSHFKSWTLYSEPYFKVATRIDATRIDSTTYNKFLQDFWEYNQNTGLFEKMLEGITSTVSEGIQCIDGFIPRQELDFRTVIVKKAWAEYNRITIQFRIKSV